MKKICVLLALFFIFPLIMFGCNESNNIKLRVKDGYIQYGYENEEEWENLLSLDELKQNSIENQNEQSVIDYKAGKDRALGFMVGQVMKASKGKANPALTSKLILEEIKKR